MRGREPAARAVLGQALDKRGQLGEGMRDEEGGEGGDEEEDEGEGAEEEDEEEGEVREELGEPAVGYDGVGWWRAGRVSEEWSCWIW